jgi:hypothetical protein
MNPRIHLLFAASGLALVSLTPLSAQEKAPVQKPKGPPPAAAQKSNGETRRYLIPPTFLISREGASQSKADPFSERSKEAGSGADQSLRMTFLKAGIELNTDDTISYDKAAEALTVTTSLSAHRQLEDYFAVLKNEAEHQIHILVEFIEVDHATFSDWIFENRITGDGNPLRKEVQKWIGAKSATILETSMVTARSGQRAKVESIHEYIYPTEFDPVSIPNTLTQAPGAEAPIAPITPTAYETRNMGTTLEIDPVIGADNITIDLNLAPEVVNLEGHTSWPSEDTDPKFKSDLPTFYTMKTTTQVTTIDGHYAFLSTMRPLEASKGEEADVLVLLFVRADIGSMGEWSVESVK